VNCDRNKESKVIEHMPNEHQPTDHQKLSFLKIALHTGLAAGAILLVCVLVLLLFPDPFMNTFIKPRIAKAFVEAYPAYKIRFTGMNYNFFKNRLGIDAVTLNAVDSTFSSTMSPFTVSGINWVHLLWERSLTINDFANSVVHAHDITITFPKLQYKLQCELLRVSVTDSEIVVEDLKFHPLGDDKQFFAGNKFRRTRFNLVSPRINIMGLACLELLQGKNFRARSTKIQDVFLDVLVNKDKPDSKDTSYLYMPNEILSSIKGTLHVDSLSIITGRLMYGERFAVGSNPAFITLDKMQVFAEGIANHGNRGAALVIHAQGKFLEAGTMKLLMSIPVASPECSFQYSGSLSGMDLSMLNSFIEISDHMRIKTGILEEATFEINVVAGQASGRVHSIYRDLTLAAVNNETGSEKGVSNGITSFVANTFKIRKSNIPDKSGMTKIGEVKYIRKRDDPFIQFVWFALRTGVRDVLGF
jgi:hypothetical protein